MAIPTVVHRAFATGRDGQGCRDASAEIAGLRLLHDAGQRLHPHGACRCDIDPATVPNDAVIDASIEETLDGELRGIGVGRRRTRNLDPILAPLIRHRLPRHRTDVDPVRAPFARSHFGGRNHSAGHRAVGQVGGLRNRAVAPIGGLTAVPPGITGCKGSDAQDRIGGPWDQLPILQPLIRH